MFVIPQLIAAVKNFIKSYLLFSKKERIGLLVVLFMLILFLFLPQIFRPKIANLQAADTAWIKEVEYQESTAELPIKAVKKIRYFYFDPNTANELEFQMLGLTSKNAQTITRYRNKGGKFRNAVDILKIWGIDSISAKALIPYIRIASSYAPGNNLTPYKRGDYYPFNTPKKPIIEINTATIAEWEALPGIGPVLAARIVKYRDKIGGFVEIEDIKKTYGIKDSLFDAIKPFLLLKNLGKPSINQASEAMLRKAGVSSSIAAAIVQYRLQYGFFETLEDLRKIVFIRDVEYNALVHLVTL